MAKTKQKPKTHGLDRRVRISAELAAMMLPFISSEEPRYYLQGIHVEPHHDEGVLLVATDGHRMAIIHDKGGETNGNWICEVPRLLRKELVATHDTSASLHFIGHGAYLTGFSFDGDPKDVGEDHLIALGAPPIDGKFVDWRRVVPDTLPSGDVSCFNAGYISDFAEVARRRQGVAITIYADGAGPAVVLVQNVPEFLGALMPMTKKNMPAAMPDWFAEKPRLVEATP